MFIVRCCHCRESSGATPKTVPSDLPHWQPSDELKQKWRDKLADDTSTLKVGLAWAGSPSNILNQQRSIPSDALKPLAQIKRVGFYSLSGRPGGRQISDKNSAPNSPILPKRPRLISRLDLAVISADTAVAHLAGAMGKEVWTMLPFISDWRWMTNRSDTPWYPSMRLFRQPSHGDWDSVICNIAQSLEKRLGGR